MNVSAPFIARPIATTLLAAALVLIGLVAYRALPVSNLPQVDFPTIRVSATRPGADPQTMAATVAAPLERRLGEISGVSELTSTSSLGSTSISVQFDLDRDIDGAARDVQAALNAATADLPGDLSKTPTFRKANPAAAPVMILALTSKTLTMGAVYDAADSIVAQRISRVAGVGDVNVGGGQQPAIRVRVDPARLSQIGVGLDTVEGAISDANVLQPLGAVDGPGGLGMIAADPQMTSPADYKPIVVEMRNGSVIRLSDIADVDLGVVDERQEGWFNRDHAVLIIITKQADANVIDTVDGVKALLPSLRSWIPQGIEISVLVDRTQTIRASFHDLEYTILLTVFLVMMVVLVFLRRLVPTIAAGVTVPLSLGGTLAAMWLMGYSLDNLSLMALTISVGFVVDDAIVMIENTMRNIERGQAPMEAALAGARQIGFTVVSISISLVAAFTPILFMSGIAGRLLHEFAMTLTFAVAVSAVVSLTVTPMVCAHYVKPGRDRPPGRLSRAAGGAMDRLTAAYAASLHWALRRRLMMGLVTLGTIGLTLWLYTAVPKGFFPEDDTGLLIGITEAAPDMSFEALAALQQKVADIVLADPAVEGLGSFVGGGRGGSSGNQGQMFVTLKPLDQGRPSAADVVNRLRPKLARIPGISAFLMPVQDLRAGARQGKGTYQFTLWDADIGELGAWVGKVLPAVKAIPGLVDVQTDRQQGGLQADLVIDRLAAARLNVTIDAIDTALNNAFAQRQISTIYGERNQYHVILEAGTDYRRDPGSLSRIYVGSTTGSQVPLSSLAHVEHRLSPLSVTHQGQFPSTTITYDLAPGTSQDEAATAIEAAVAGLHPPDSLHAEFSGNAAAQRQTQSQQPVLILAALLTIYLVLGVLYESVIHPLTILSTLPSAGLGALLALEATGQELTLVALIGIILLIGLVKKNGIMLVDFALEAQRRDGLDPEAAVIRACIERFRPILMTTLAAILGAVPLALASGPGAAIRIPLGITIIGGLVVSQFLTAYTTPVIYLFFDRLAARWRPGPRPRSAQAA